MDELFELCSLSEFPAKERLEYLKKFSHLRDVIAEGQSKHCLPLHSVPSLPLSSDDKIKGLEKWLRLQELFISPSIGVKKLDENVGFSVICKTSIKKNEALLRIPVEHVCLRAESFDKTDLALGLPKNEIDEPLKLVLVILDELKKSGSSYYKPYFDCLPRHLDLPIFMSGNELSFLNGSLHVEKLLRVFRSVFRRYLGMYRLLRTKWSESEIPRRFHILDYLWATGIAMSRQNNIGDEKVLMPYLDFFNHTTSHGEFTSYFDANTNSYEKVAYKDYEEGEEIFMFYGKRSNFELFTYAGFVLPNLEYDTVLVTFTLASRENDAKYSEKVASLKEMQLTGTVFEIPLKRGEFNESISLESFKHSPLHQLVSIISGSSNTIEVIKYIQIRLKLLLRLITKDNEDKAPLSYREKICFGLKREEASILKELLQGLDRLSNDKTQ